jgi:long-chain acyl-CoA synthetase
MIKKRDDNVNGWSKDLIPLAGARTLDGLFWQRARRSPRRIAYRWFERGAGAWRSMTWAEVREQVGRWRQSLSAEGLNPGDRVAMVLRNCPDWVIFDQAALSLGLVTVPLYTDDRADSAAYILKDAGVRLLLMQDANRWRRISDAVGSEPCPGRVVLLDTGEEAMRLVQRDPRVVIARDWLPTRGPEWPQRDGDPDALATIVYTSGTTGRPKGVMLSHNNILSNAHAGLAMLTVYQEDEFLSFLPLSHTLERTAGYYLPIISGSTVTYARSIPQLAADLEVIRPTVIIAVPRVFERVYQRLHDQLRSRSALARWLFQIAVEIGWRRFERQMGRARAHPLLILWPLLERLVARKVLVRLGGRLRAAVSGGAALPLEVSRLFIGLGLPLVQGYGLTETSPVVAVNPLEANLPASVGPPLRGIEVRIGADDELLVRGPCNMLGYWNNQAATAQVLEADGWLHTGDQARIDNGYIFITGRIKDILVLSTGEKVSPGDMETAIGLDPLFEQALVVGEGRSFLAALLVLNADLWPSLAADYGLESDRSDSLREPRLVKDILKRVREDLRDFPGYAKIRRATLILEPWSIDNGMMTPTMKLKRQAILDHHRQQVELMYAGEG